MLVNAPLENQLGPNASGAVDANARQDCVSASLAAAVNALVGTRLGPGDLKDRAYSPSYTGATDPLAYAGVLATYGLRLSEYRSPDGAALVARVQADLARGVPVYGAIPSQWGIVTAAQIAAGGGPTHAVLFCDANPAAGTLTAMNPWPVDGRNAFYQTMPASWWASRLVYTHVISVERTAPVALKRLNPTTVADDHGAQIHYAIGDWALAHHPSANILLPETYGFGDGRTFDSFAALSDGAVLAYKQGEGATVHEDRGAQVVASLLGRLQAALHPAAPAPAPAALAVSAAVQAEMAVVRAHLANVEALLEQQ